MKLKFVFSLTIGFLLIMSMGQFGLGSSQPSTEIKERSVDTSELFDFSAGMKDSFVIFTESQSDFRKIMNTQDGIIKGYPRLGAILLETSYRNAEQLAKYGPISPTSIIPQVYAPTAVSTESPDGVTLDSLEDAPRMGVTNLWAQGYYGQGVTVGIVDDGYEDHPGLQGRLENMTWFDKGPDGVRYPEHGIWVAGTVSGTGEFDSLAMGNAPNSTFYMAGFKTIDTGQGKAFYFGPDAINYFDAYEFMLGLNSTVRIVNFSGGGGYWYGVDYILKRFELSNMLLVASAGNEGPGSGTVGCPSCGVEALSVGATVRDSKDATAAFSSRGPGYFPVMKPDVVAPGVSVYTTGKGGVYERVSGTSFSSPLTAGAIATLISALEANNITYNIGSLKASVLRGAFSQEGTKGDYERGAGLVNISRSYNYLLSNLGASNFANSLALTPLDNGFMNVETLSGVQTTVNSFTVITSNMSDVVLNLSGDLAPNLSIDMTAWNNSRYSQQIILKLNTTGLEARTYTATLTASMGGQQVNATIRVKILGPAKGTVAMDLWHTDWDDFGADTLTGSNTGEMVKIFINKGYWVEEIHETITSTLLSNYDILWMPDPFNLVNFAGQDLTLSEKTAILDFVDAGGSVFIDFNGPFVSSGNPGGADATKISDLTSNWGILPFTDSAQGDINARTIPVYNVSSFTKGATTVTHAGNWIALDKTTAAAKSASVTAVTGDDTRSSIVIYDQIGGGRVVVTSTNFWMDNLGAVNGYAADGDRALSRNTVDWLGANSTEKLQIVSESRVDNILTLTVTSQSPITASRIDNGFFGYLSLPVTDNGDGTFTISYEATEDGSHDIIIQNSDEYLRRNIELDLNGPEIIVDRANYSDFTGEELAVFVKFKIIDNLYDVQFSDIQVLFNGATVDPTVFRTFYVNHELKVNVPVQTLEQNVIHVLTVKASDNKGHTTVVNWMFSINLVTTTTTTPTTNSTTTPGTTTPTTNTTTTSTSPTTTSTTTTATSTTETQSSQTNDSGAPAPIIAILTSLFVVVAVLRRRKY